MSRARPWIRQVRWWQAALPCFAAFLGGCETTSQHMAAGHSHGVDACASIPPGAIGAPLGTYLEEFVSRHALKAEQDDFVIYKQEWLKKGTELGPYGTYHIHEMAKRMPVAPFPVILQVSGNADLDLARRGVVVNRLLNLGVLDAEQRVLLDLPEAEGLYGEEAEPIYNQMLRGGSGSGGGGFGGGGFGGGGGGRGFGGGGRRGFDDRRGF